MSDMAISFGPLRCIACGCEPHESDTQCAGIELDGELRACRCHAPPSGITARVAAIVLVGNAPELELLPKYASPAITDA